MILLLLAFFFRDPVELVALGAVCKSCCVATLFAGCFMEMSVAAEGGRRLTLRYIVHSLDIWTYAMAAISWFFLGRNVFFQDPFVVITYYAFHVWHAAIAYFEIASVAIFSELVAGIAKMLVNQSQELFADVCAYVLAERWIKPYNIARSAFLCIALLLSRLVG